MRRPFLLVTLAIVGAAALLAPATASADFQTLYNDFRADNVIDGCSYSAADLSAGLNEIPADVREYDPAFSDALNAALEQSAAGCNAAPKQAASIQNEISAPDGSPGPSPPKGLALGSSGDARQIPEVLIGLMVVLGAGLGAAGALVAARRYGWGASGRSQPKGSDA
jgi:hypothetical protein